MKKPNFSRKPLSFSIALALSVYAGSPALAQDEDESENENETQILEEVVVTGIRGSLYSAQVMKESADTFVDGLSASRKRQTLTASRWKVLMSSSAACPLFAPN